MGELLQSIGAFACLIVGGAWLLRFNEERQDNKLFQAELKRLQERKLSHPEEAERCAQALSAMLDEALRKKRRGLFS